MGEADLPESNNIHGIHHHSRSSSTVCTPYLHIKPTGKKQLRRLGRRRRSAYGQEQHRHQLMGLAAVKTRLR
jgi:hypothetical protein